jgi:1-deoxy-D-xylulose 5-phosphate reductoisomerase
MKTYTVKFEIYGKRMKTTVNADNEYQVKEFIKNKIIFHSIEDESDFLDTLSDIFGMKFK